MPVLFAADCPRPETRLSPAPGPDPAPRPLCPDCAICSPLLVVPAYLLNLRESDALFREWGVTWAGKQEFNIKEGWHEERGGGRETFSGFLPRNKQLGEQRKTCTEEYQTSRISYSFFLLITQLLSKIWAFCRILTYFRPPWPLLKALPCRVRLTSYLPTIPRYTSSEVGAATLTGLL